jgi:hypothetical protein
MKIGGHPLDLLVDIGTTHSVVTQLMGPFSQRHVTIVRPWEVRLAAPSSYPENAILESMK